MISIKEKLIERIKANKDEALLEEIYNLLENEEKECVQFSEEQKNIINESKEAYQKGKVISDEEVQKKVNKWLGE